MKKFIHTHKRNWTNKNFVVSVLAGCLLLLEGLVLNYIAGTYAAQHAGNAVNDILLDNLPVFNVGIIFVESISFLIFFTVTVLVYKPNYIPFVVKSIGVFYIIRSIFVTLTHLGQYPSHAQVITDGFVRFLTFGGDLFFSGHAGLPFLMALIFWENEYLRATFLAISFLLAVCVLLGHLHYSIDVFAAYFITYTIFHIAQRLFPHDYSLALHGGND